MTGKYLWQAAYRNGTTLREDGVGNGPGASFGALPLADLTRFSLLEALTVDEVVGLDLRTGFFRICGRDVELQAGGEPLVPSSGEGEGALLQFKTAHADWRAGQGGGGTVVDAYHIGYRFEVAGARGEALVAVRAADGRVRLEVRWGSRRPHPDVRVLMDGIPYDACPALRVHG